MFRYGIETQNFCLQKTNYENDKPSIIKICKYTSRHCCPKNSISTIAMPHPENVFTIYFNYLIRGTAHVFLKLYLPPFNCTPPVRLDIRQLTSPIRDKRRGRHFQTALVLPRTPILRIWIKEMLRTIVFRAHFPGCCDTLNYECRIQKGIFYRLRWHL